MISEARIQKIVALEKSFNTVEKVLKTMQSALESWENALPDFIALTNYYWSDQWQKDKEDSDKGTLMLDSPHGVLSEDAIYSLYQEQRQLALDLMKSAIKMLE